MSFEAKIDASVFYLTTPDSGSFATVYKHIQMSVFYLTTPDSGSFVAVLETHPNVIQVS